jgi:hypothetical protein
MKYGGHTGTLLIATAALVLAGCVTSHVIVGKVRPPISPDAVQLYLHPPAGHYEEIAILDTSSRHSFSITAQGKVDAVVGRLKSEAAKLGANGILIREVGDREAGTASAGVGGAVSGTHGTVGLGFGSSDIAYIKSGSGIAIYVEP